MGIQLTLMGKEPPNLIISLSDRDQSLSSILKAFLSTKGLANSNVNWLLTNGVVHKLSRLREGG